MGLGCAQRPGVDYAERWAPTPAAATTRTLLAVVAGRGLALHHVDVKTAYLHANMDAEVYIEQPKEYPLGEPGLVGRLNRALYGTRQAGRLWADTFKSVMLEAGAVQSPADQCLYTLHHHTHGPIYFLVYVDDILVAARSEQGVTAGKAVVTRHFEVRDLGEARDFLGMKIERDRLTGKLKVSSPGHIKALLQAYGMQDAAPNATPMTTGLTFETEQDSGEQQHMQYAELVGGLLYLATTTRPDIAYATNVLSRFMTSNNDKHWRAAKGVLRYLAGTIQLGLVYGQREGIQGYCDADFAGCQQTRKSTTGVVFTLYGGAIMWQSKRQSIVTTSTAEAEYVAASAAVKEALWVRKLLATLGERTETIPLGEDNQACLRMITSGDTNKRTKHVDVALHHVRDRVARGDVVFRYTPTRDMTADGLTKPLPAPAFRAFRSMLGIGDGCTPVMQ